MTTQSRAAAHGGQAQVRRSSNFVRLFAARVSRYVGCGASERDVFLPGSVTQVSRAVMVFSARQCPSYYVH
jgi:hypothetical protein